MTFMQQPLMIHRRVTRRLLGMGVALLAVSTPTAAQTEAASPEACVWEEVGRRRLTLESGALAYVEPQSTVTTQRGTLLIGSPSWVWKTTLPWDAGVSWDSIVGAVLGPTGEATGVLSPIPGAELSSFSVIGNDDGTWTVAFVELEPGTREPGVTSVVERVGYGVFDGTEWHDVVTEPVPHGVELQPLHPSGLVSTADTLLWALRTQEGNGHVGVAVLRRSNDRWDFLVEEPWRVWGVSAASIRGKGQVAVARIDSVFMTRAEGTLRVGPPGQEEGPGVFLVSPGSGRFLNPVFEFVEDPNWIGWLADIGDSGGTEARAARLYPPDSSGTAVVLDPRAGALHPVGRFDDEASYWISTHSGDAVRIRFVRAIGSRTEVLLEIPYPFDGPFGVAATGPSSVLITGPVMTRDERSPPVTTLLIDLRRRCEGTP